MSVYTQKLFTSRAPGSANIFIGELGRMFYSQEDGLLRLSDGVTPGGHIVSNGGGNANIILTTFGNTGASTYTGNILNIPVYTGFMETILYIWSKICIRS